MKPPACVRKPTPNPMRAITPKGEETYYEYDKIDHPTVIRNSYGMVELGYDSWNFDGEIIVQILKHVLNHKNLLNSIRY